jgi:transposase
VLSVGSSEILLWRSPVSMRKSYHGLAALVFQAGRSPVDGAHYVFVNREATQVKILRWEGDGLAIWGKRLEKGRFRVPEPRDGRVMLDRRSLALLLEGVTPLKMAPRYAAPAAAKNIF